MTRYHMNEGSFELADDDALDATVHAMEADLGGATLRLVVERGRLDEAGLEALAARRAAEEAERLPGFSLLLEREATYAGAPALEFCARFRRDDELAYLRRAHVRLGDHALSFSASAPMSRRDACDAFMDAVLESLRVRAT